MIKNIRKEQLTFFGIIKNSFYILKNSFTQLSIVLMIFIFVNIFLDIVVDVITLEILSRLYISSNSKIYNYFINMNIFIFIFKIFNMNFLCLNVSSIVKQKIKNKSEKIIKIIINSIGSTSKAVILFIETFIEIKILSFVCLIIIGIISIALSVFNNDLMTILLIIMFPIAWFILVVKVTQYIFRILEISYYGRSRIRLFLFTKDFQSFLQNSYLYMTISLVASIIFLGLELIIKNSILDLQSRLLFTISSSILTSIIIFLGLLFISILFINTTRASKYNKKSRISKNIRKRNLGNSSENIFKLPNK